MKKRLLFIFVIAALLVSALPVSVLAGQQNDIIILYENDVHCEVEGYSKEVIDEYQVELNYVGLDYNFEV